MKERSVFIAELGDFICSMEFLRIQRGKKFKAKLLCYLTTADVIAILKIVKNEK